MKDKTAEDKWIEWEEKQFSYDMSNARNAYKEALRERIDILLADQMRNPTHQYNGGMIDAYKTVLNLLKEIEPPKP